jgi:hypothetical protein
MSGKERNEEYLAKLKQAELEPSGVLTGLGIRDRLR